MSARGLATGGGSGFLAAMALPPFHLWPLAFVALVPLIVTLRAPGLSPRQVAGAGVAFGAVYFGLLLHWVPFTVGGILPLGFLTGLLLLVILSGLGGIVATALHRLLIGGASPWLAVPAVWVGAELLLAHAGPLAFPWISLGLALAPVPELAGIAEVGGVRAVSFWIATANGGAAAWVDALRIRPRSMIGDEAEGRERGAGVRVAGAAAVALVMVAPGAWGMWRAERLPVEELPPVLLVQLDIPRSVLADPAARARAAADDLDRIVASAAEAEGPWAVAVLPEAIFPSEWDEAQEARFTGYARTLDTPLLVGARLNGSNGVILVSPDETWEPVHRKARLVPGVERPGLSPGPAGGAFDIGDLRLGLVVCFESAFGAETRRLARDGMALLVNPTNDGWFVPARGAWAVGSPAHAQHRAHLQLRAIEARTGAVRSALGGELLVVGPTGRILGSVPAGGDGALTVHPVTSSVVPLQVRAGDFGGWAALLVLVLLGARVRMRGAASRPRAGA